MERIVDGAVCLLWLGVLVVCIEGCKGTRPTPIDWPNPAGDGGLISGTDTDSLPQDVLLTDLFGPCTFLQRVYFDYDSAALTPAAAATLAKNTEYIKQNPNVYRIEGHCDERGTQEYNLALGEKRSLAVRAHLVKLGVPGDSLITLSYGEESPADLGHDENAWRKNRRCEFSVRTAR